MHLFIVILAIGFLQVWGANNPLHKDRWFYNWCRFLKGKESVPKTEVALLAGKIGVPMVVVALFGVVLGGISSWLLLPYGVVILLYSFGRGEFNDLVNEYIFACNQDDWEEALVQAKGLNVSVENLKEGDWSTLHQHFLDEAGYKGFERMFAVLFWFFLLGPMGALAYRLVRLDQVREEGDVGGELSARLLWILEWPVVRVLGLSFAFTGNFTGCYLRWKECLVCFHRSTIEVLSNSILGALSVDDELDQTCDVTKKELGLLVRLYTRTLWFWLAITSLGIILI